MKFYEIKSEYLFWDTLNIGPAEGDFALLYNGVTNTLYKHGFEKPVRFYFTRFRSNAKKLNSGYLTDNMTLVSFPVNKKNIEVVNFILEHSAINILNYLSKNLQVGNKENER